MTANQASTDTQRSSETDEEKQEASWATEKERSTPLGIRFTIAFLRFFGRAPAKLLIRIVIFYYTLTSPKVKPALVSLRSRLGLETKFWDVYQHLVFFAQSIVDAMIFSMGKGDSLECEHPDHDALRALAGSGQGAILLGSHIGNLYAMRRRSSDREISIRPVAYFKNATGLNQLISTLNPELAKTVIHMGEDQVSAMLAVKEAIDGGDLVAIMGDRKVDANVKSVEVDFLGDKVLLPVGPYIMAATLRCPLYFVAGIYIEPNRYILRCIELADKVVLPRKTRQEAIRGYAQAYADQMAAVVREHPHNWYNFFDFWQEAREVEQKRQSDVEDAA